MRADKKRRQINTRIESELKSLSKKANSLLSSNKKEEAKAAVLTYVSKLDKAANKKILHKNTASRRKSRILKKLSKLSAA
jgi:small subunit ribosomal protein S20